MNTDQHLAATASDAGATLTPTQRTLMEIWRRMLWLDEIGVHDNFIELGGNSLSAMRCINRVRETFEVDVPIDAFFLDPGDIATMARLIDDVRTGGVLDRRPLGDRQAR
jgi:acyl carrier protein